MEVNRIAECSSWSILQYFRPALSDNWSFLSGHLRQVLLYNQPSIYIMHTSVCVSVCVKNTTQMSTEVGLICLDPSFQKMTHHFLLHGSLWPTNLEKNLKPRCNGMKAMFYLNKPAMTIVLGWSIISIDQCLSFLSQKNVLILANSPNEIHHCT